MRRMHRVVWVAALAAVGVALAGCSAHAGSGSTGTQSGGGSSGGSSDSGSAPTQSALLTAADLPQGVQISPIDVQQAMQQGAGMSKGQPTNGQCQQLAMAGLQPTDLHGVGMTAVQPDTKTASAITETVFAKPSGFDLSGERAAVKSCGNITTNMGRMQVTVKTTEGSLSGVHADDSLLLHQDIQLQGAPDMHPAGNDIAFVVLGKRIIVLISSGGSGVVDINQLAQKAVQQASKS